MTAAENRPNLWRVLALRDDYPQGQCWAWMDSPGKRCTRPDAPQHPHLCPRHATTALRRLQKLHAKQQAKQAAADARNNDPDVQRRHRERRSTLERKLERVEAELQRRGGSGPTDDRAAYGGATVSTVSRWRARQLSDSNVTRMVELLRQRDHLRTQILMIPRHEPS